MIQWRRIRAADVGVDLKPVLGRLRQANFVVCKMFSKFLSVITFQ